MTKTWSLTLAAEGNYGFLVKKFDKIGGVRVKLFL